VDGLRAVAVLPVLFFHANLGCPGGYVGVDIFFVISGYLITGLILKDLDAGQFHIVKFWERRVRRILPAVAFVMFATLVAGWLLLLPQGFKELGESTSAQILLVSNIYFWVKSWIGAGYFAPAAEVKPETPAAEAPVEPVAVVPAPEAAAPATEAESTPAAVAEPKPKKPRAPRKPKPAEPSAPLDLGIAEAAAPVVAAVSAADDFSQVPPNEPVEKSISADGATRLLVTAYIGIGNRLFIRGDGPGLTWDKGVPLQFVSIGKWRWETAEATAPVQYKLYKNDELECAALGAQTLESGSQQEVTATF